MRYYEKGDAINMKISDKINAKTLWGAAAFGVGILGMVISNKNDAIQKNALKEEAAKEAAKIVMKQMASSNQN